MGYIQGVRCAQIKEPHMICILDLQRQWVLISNHSSQLLMTERTMLVDVDIMSGEQVQPNRSCGWTQDYEIATAKIVIYIFVNIPITMLINNAKLKLKVKIFEDIQLLRRETKRRIKYQSISHNDKNAHLMDIPLFISFYMPPGNSKRRRLANSSWPGTSIT